MSNSVFSTITDADWATSLRRARGLKNDISEQIKAIVMDKYAQFLASKAKSAPATGFEDIPPLNPALFNFQRDVTTWALRRGRAAIWEDCGLGKTFQQLEWARVVRDNAPGDVLILAPLAVAPQTIAEGARFGIPVNHAQCQADVKPGINITNYERLGSFDASQFVGVVLDESSILKSYDGKTRTAIIEAFARTRFKLACTATPAPNDFMEIGNHAEFLNVMSRVEMLATFFVHDGGETQKWRLKGHAENEFWAWVASWAVMIRKPSDLGYDDGDFVLPELRVHQITVESNAAPALGFLFEMPAATLQERIQARRASISERVEKAVELASADDDQWLIWCNLNDESKAIAAGINGAVEITGSDTPEHKTETMLGFAGGTVKRLVSKSSICGFGLNFQQCHKVAFVGLSDSYEEFYQAVRRCWRFGQKNVVDCYIITAAAEGVVVANILRKEADALRMAENMANHMKDLIRANIRGAQRERDDYKTEVVEGKGWTAYLGDCVAGAQALPANSVDYSIFSPPFASLYTYSNSERDMGNCKDDAQFFEHFTYLTAELFRVIKPGRLVSFHCMNLPTSKQNNGYIGIRDFRGELIRVFEQAGFIYHAEVTIWKDPVTAMQRTKALGLLHKTIRKDSAMSRQGVPDYLVTMRKPGENAEPIKHTADDFPVAEWQQLASPVWASIEAIGDDGFAKFCNPYNGDRMGIDATETLQRKDARDEKDERHICPLQLEVIKRGIRLWTNPGDLVYTPFGGIGSEGFVALQLGREAVLSELKKSYFRVLCENMKRAEVRNETLFDAPMNTGATCEQVDEPLEFA